MSKAIQTKTSKWMLMVLLIGFSIANVSSFMAQSMVPRGLAGDDFRYGEGDIDWSALESCPLEQRLKGQSGKDNTNALETVCDATYEKNGKTVKQKIRVRKVVTGDKPEDWEFQVNVNMETECSDCASGKNVGSTGVMRPNTQNFGELRDFIQSRGSDASAKFLAYVQKQKELEKKKHKCEVSPDGEKWESIEQKRDCLISNIEEGVYEDEEAAQLFNKHFKTSLTQMLQSGDPAKMSKAMGILGKFRDITENGYINSSVQDMMMFGNMKLRAMRLESQMGMFAENDPRRARLEQQAAMLNRQADGYFNGRMMEVQNQSMSLDSGFEYAYSLIADLQTFQSELDMSLSHLVSTANSNASNNPNGTPVNPNGQPVNIANRNSRGAPAPNNGAVNGNGAPSGIPQVGSTYGGGPGYQHPPMGGQQPPRPPGMGNPGNGMPPGMGNPGNGMPPGQPPPPWQNPQVPDWARNLPHGPVPGGAHGPGAGMPQPRPQYSAVPYPGGIGPGGTPYFNPRPY